MFKAASDSTQSRIRRATVDGRKNTAGVDPSAFKDGTTELRIQLCARKQELEFEICKLNAFLGEADRRRQSYRRGPETDRSTVARWIAQKANIVSELGAIGKRLSFMKVDRLNARAAEEARFERRFFRAAKSMLAQDVFERVLVAASHFNEAEK